MHVLDFHMFSIAQTWLCVWHITALACVSFPPIYQISGPGNLVSMTTRLSRWLHLFN